MKIGSEEEIRAAGEEAYRFLFDHGCFDSAMAMAEDVYGRDSDEWRRASGENEAVTQKREQKEREKEEKKESGEWDLKVAISKDATFADLFSAIDVMEEGEELDESLAQELYDNFAEDIADEVLSLRDPDQASKATVIKVIDFFRERGYSQSDVSAYLPIKFSRAKKNQRKK